MGKIKQSDLDKLKEAGKLSASAEKSLKQTKSVSKKTTSTRRFMKTKNGTFVSPSLYFRGGRGLEPSNDMIKFQTEYEKLVTKYTTTSK
jgi:hypothetical protein|tara:strand:+ start:87 stop:353 length:267 start_codon:yes stop_codon:yes gene_type:complete